MQTDSARGPSLAKIGSSPVRRLSMRLGRAAVSLAACSAALTGAHAATIASLSPQGEVPQAQQIAVRFSAAVVPFGDLRQPAPLQVTCNVAAPAGTGRWTDASHWVYDFAEPLGPGVRCTVGAQPGWVGLDGAALTGKTSFAFSTGGPVLRAVQPGRGATIEEEQHFLVEPSGPATPASVLAHAWCEIDGLGERVPVRIATEAERTAVLTARHVQPPRAGRMLLLACARPLPADAAVRLMWGAGIAAAADPSVVTRKDQRTPYRVRKGFTAEFSCERERANAGCMPIRPMRLGFSSPVARASALQARLVPIGGGSAALAPTVDADDHAEELSTVQFAGPLAENTRYTLTLPAGLRDVAGRPLVNAALFPLAVATADSPPLAKFAAAPFGIVELHGDANAANAATAPPPMLPVTLRHVQPDLRGDAPPKPATAASAAPMPAGQVRALHLQRDAEIFDWFVKLATHHETQLPARELGLPASEWTTVERGVDADGTPWQRTEERFVRTREVSLLKTAAGARRLDLPALQGGDPRPFEVVGIPLPEPGYHVVEIESPRLGASLLGKPAPMYVRTGVLVTNLGVHFKHGRENSLVWVTTLDRGQPVDAADVTVHDCNGQPLWHGRTDAQGLARITQPLADEPPRCRSGEGYFVTAHTTDARGMADVAFVFSGWQKGIEAWRFNQPIASGNAPDIRAHTVFDRTLLRAGETVSMKHFIRTETSHGLAAVPAAALPTRVRLMHVGSGEELTLPITWAAGAPGQPGPAVSTWPIPPTAKLGTYTVRLERDALDAAHGPRSWPSGDFRVEEFRLPLVDARLSGPAGVQIAPAEMQLQAQLSYLSGGGVAQAPLKVSAVLQPRSVQFDGYDGYSFEPPRGSGNSMGAGDDASSDDEADEGEDNSAASQGRLVADKLALATDAKGAATVQLTKLPPITRASNLQSELTFNDPNGEVQTVATTTALWPSAVVLGIRAGSWASSRGKVSFTVLALDTSGKPIANQAVEVQGRNTQTLSSRKRIVGGFYAYDNRREVKDLGALCSGRTDAHGLLLCDAQLQSAGEVELIARAADAAGHAVQAATSIWVTRQGELWFAQDNDDRMDVLPEKPRYEPGETARLQVRMPFRVASALVAVEREGVLQTQVVTLHGDDPTVELKVDAAWGPNVYVSVLALRGRIREVPWYSFFTWGWKQPVEWAKSFWFEGREYQAPTALVDLAKPAFKLGVAAFKVGIAEHELQVAVTADKEAYTVRGKALARVKVTQGGKPVAGADVAFAAVDESLLALRDNSSWDLLHGMVQQRGWGVETSTAQSEVIGRRHYGRKAVAPGGGGGHGATRELFDSLLLWRPTVALDANGEATVEVPLNDSLTSFRLVAVAASGVQRFGTGSARIRTTQDLQLLPGLPPLVREGDRYSALLTVRNTTARTMQVQATLAGVANAASGPGPERSRTPIALPPQALQLAPGAAQELTWPIEVPAQAFSIDWEGAVHEVGGSGAAAADRVKLTQLVSAAVPERVLQATLTQLDGSASLPVAAPADAVLLGDGVTPRGGVRVAVQPRLGGALPGIRRYFETYPYNCLEQMASKAIGLKDAAQWAKVVAGLPGYLDGDGLASYYPPRGGSAASGSDRLTAYLIAASDASGFALPPALRNRMLDGLQAFVEGRLERRTWAPRKDLDARKLAAIEALSRHGRAQPRMLGSIDIAPSRWPTATLLDWLTILKRLPAIDGQPRLLDEANQLLRGRLTFAGTTLTFSTEADDFWWWLMDSPDGNAARLILAVLDDPAWKDELPRLVVGSLGRQHRGAWLTTTANLWGAIALDKFSARFEQTPVAGTTVARIGPTQPPVPVADWTRQPQGGAAQLPWPPASAPSTLEVQQQGSGKPWLTVQSIAAVPLTAPLRAGYAIARSVSAIERRVPNAWSKGDVLRVRIEVDAQSDMSWVVVSDPVPAGATLLGSGLGRDSTIAATARSRDDTADDRGRDSAWPAFEERSFEAYRSVFSVLPRGKHVVEYTLRLNNPGRFNLPPTRVEAMYAPETFGEAPNAVMEVGP